MVISAVFMVALCLMYATINKITGGSFDVITAKKGQIQAFYAADGIMTLLCQEILDNNGEKYVSNKDPGGTVTIDGGGGGGGGSTPEYGYIYLDMYKGITGADVSDLTSNAKYPDSPDTSACVPAFGLREGEDWPCGVRKHVHQNYGLRYRGFVHPTISGNYQFRVCANSHGQVFLSTDADPAHKALIVEHKESVIFTDECQSSIPKSANIGLIAGKAYYIEALFKEDGTKPFAWMRVGWIGPDSVEVSPLSGKNISSIVSPYPPTIGGSSTTVWPAGTWVDSIWDIGPGMVKAQYLLKRDYDNGGYSIATEGYKGIGTAGRSYSSKLSQIFGPGSGTQIFPGVAYIPVIFNDFHSGIYDTVPPRHPVTDFQYGFNRVNTGCPWACCCGVDKRPTGDDCRVLWGTPGPPCKGFDPKTGRPGWMFDPFPRHGLVETTLGTNRKPVATPKSISDSMATYRINSWFRPSGPGESVSSTASTFLQNPVDSVWRWNNMVPYLGRTGEYVASDFDANNSFACVQIYDSLPFARDTVGHGPNSSFYRFSYKGDDNRENQIFGYNCFEPRWGSGCTPILYPNCCNLSPPFFPIDGRGFGNFSTEVIGGHLGMRDQPIAPDGRRYKGLHNFSFTMEMHNKFEFQNGLVFTFEGDDGLWLFINNRLVVDMGGCGHSAPSTIDLDTLFNGVGAPLETGKWYTFDLFSWENMVVNSQIEISTNIPFYSAAAKPRRSYHRNIGQ